MSCYRDIGTVQKPYQYIGHEENAYRKDFDAAAVRLCLAFPDAYEIGMSNVVSIEISPNAPSARPTANKRIPGCGVAVWIRSTRNRSASKTTPSAASRARVRLNNARMAVRS